MVQRTSYALPGEAAPDDVHTLRHGHTLTDMLQVAVPLRIQELRGLPPEELRKLTPELSHGDELMYGGRHAASEAAALITGLAVLALTSEGGVTFARMHWCGAEHVGCPSRPVFSHLGRYRLPEPVPAPRGTHDVHLPSLEVPNA